jgi:hypothetical protein
MRNWGLSWRLCLEHHPIFDSHFRQYKVAIGKGKYRGKPQGR